MDTSREDVGIAIRSAFLQKGTQQRFSLFILIIISVFLLFIESIESKPLNFLRSIIKDAIYRGSAIVSFPVKSVEAAFEGTINHITLYSNYEKLKKEKDAAMKIKKAAAMKMKKAKGKIKMVIF